jgi:hypothetical protein
MLKNIAKKVMKNEKMAKLKIWDIKRTEEACIKPFLLAKANYE